MSMSTASGQGWSAVAELEATGPERHGWRINVETQRGIEAYGVLIAPAGDSWRARILTFPNILWLGPDRQTTLKFEGRSPQDAERQAIEFIREHCRRRDYAMRDEVATVVPDALPDAAPVVGEQAQRKVRFLPIAFGTDFPSERAKVGNLSETGLFIITNTPAQQGDKLNLVLHTETSELPLEGVVKWMRNAHRIGRAPGMGIALEDPPEGYVEYVRALA